MTQRPATDAAIDLDAIGYDVTVTSPQVAIDPNQPDVIDEAIKAQIIELWHQLPYTSQESLLKELKNSLENDDDSDEEYDWQNPNDNLYLLSAEELERLAIQKASS